MVKGRISEKLRLFVKNIELPKQGPPLAARLLCREKLPFSEVNTGAGDQNSGVLTPAFGDIHSILLSFHFWDVS